VGKEVGSVVFGCNFFILSFLNGFYDGFFFISFKFNPTCVF
jgi:hypothetical protein